MLKVQLRNYSPNPDAVVASAAKVCYSNKSIDEIYQKLLEDPEENKKFVQKLVDMHHESPLEHVSFTFSIEGVSRALTHQLVRHRLASYSQKSQRYVSEKQFEYVIPKTIQKKEEAKNIFEHMMKSIQLAYDALTDLGIPKEDARYVLPNACETAIIVTMNARELINFFGHRCCIRAQWEIRDASKLMLEQVKEVAPFIFNNIGANCETLGYCPENNMSCGKKPTLKQLLSNQ